MSAFTKEHWQRIAPSRALLKFVDLFASPEHPFVLDAACGSGRNAIALSVFGCDVVCADVDRCRLEKIDQLKATLPPITGCLIKVCTDLCVEAWPFADEMFSGLISVHFAGPDLIPVFARSLVKGGMLFIETVGNMGENYRQLPKANDFRRGLEKYFDIKFYRERAAGPPDVDAVCVTLLAEKRS